MSDGATRMRYRDTEDLSAYSGAAGDYSSSAAAAADQRDEMATPGAMAFHAEMSESFDAVMMMSLAAANGMAVAFPAGSRMEYLSSRMW